MPGKSEVAARKIKSMILSGKFPTDSRLPSERALAKILKSSQGTVTKATTLLEADGFIKKRHGSGNYVLKSSHPANICFLVEKLNDKLNPVWFQAYESFYLAASGSPVETHAAIVLPNETELGLNFPRVPDVIVAGLSLNPERVEKLLSCGCPVVWLEQYSEKLPGTTICFDNFAAGEMAAKHLLDQGCRKIMYFTSIFKERAHYPSSVRFEGLLRGIALYGSPDCSVSSYALNADSEMMLMELGDVLRTVDGVFAFSDKYSTYVGRAAHLARIRIPEDLALIGVDGLPMCELFNPPLSTLSQHPERLGAKAFDSVMEILAGREADNRIVLQPELVIRESSRKPSASESKEAG